MSKKYKNKLKKKLEKVEENYSKSDKISEVKNLYLGKDKTGKRSGKIHRIKDRYEAVEKFVQSNYLSDEEKAFLSECTERTNEYDLQLDKKRKSSKYSKDLKEKRESHKGELESLINKYEKAVIHTENSEYEVRDGVLCKVKTGKKPEKKTIENKVSKIIDNYAETPEPENKYDLTGTVIDLTEECDKKTPKYIPTTSPSNAGENITAKLMKEVKDEIAANKTKNPEGLLTRFGKGIRKYRTAAIASLAALALGILFGYSQGPKKEYADPIVKHNIVNINKKVPSIENPKIYHKGKEIDYKGSDIELPLGTYVAMPGKGNVDKVKLNILHDGKPATDGALKFKVEDGKNVELDQLGTDDGNQVASTKLRIKCAAPEPQKEVLKKEVLKFSEDIGDKQLPEVLPPNNDESKKRSIVKKDDETKLPPVIIMSTPKEERTTALKIKTPGDQPGWFVNYGNTSAHGIDGVNEGVVEMQTMADSVDIVDGTVRGGVHIAADVLEKKFFWEDSDPNLKFNKRIALDRWLYDKLAEGYGTLGGNKHGLFLVPKEDIDKYKITVNLDKDNKGGIFPKRPCYTFKWEQNQEDYPDKSMINPAQDTI